MSSYSDKQEELYGRAHYAGEELKPLPAAAKENLQLITAYREGLDNRNTNHSIAEKIDRQPIPEQDKIKLKELDKEASNTFREIAVGRLDKHEPETKHSPAQLEKNDRAFSSGERGDFIPKEASGDLRALNAYSKGLDAHESALKKGDSASEASLAKLRSAVDKEVQNVVLNRTELTREVEKAQPRETYSGAIYKVTKDTLYQDVGDKVIAHDRSALVGKPELTSEKALNREVEIKYPAERAGLVKDLTERQSGDRGREQEKSFSFGER